MDYVSSPSASYEVEQTCRHESILNSPTCDLLKLEQIRGAELVARGQLETIDPILLLADRYLEPSCWIDLRYVLTETLSG